MSLGYWAEAAQPAVHGGPSVRFDPAVKPGPTKRTESGSPPAACTSARAAVRFTAPHPLSGTAAYVPTTKMEKAAGADTLTPPYSVPPLSARTAVTATRPWLKGFASNSSVPLAWMTGAELKNSGWLTLRRNVTDWIGSSWSCPNPLTYPFSMRVANPGNTWWPLPCHTSPRRPQHANDGRWFTGSTAMSSCPSIV